MTGFQIRTDLALEEQEGSSGAKGKIHGVTVEEYDNKENEIHITKVMIHSKNGAKAMNKPMGNYITLEAPCMQEADEDYHREVSKELAAQLKEMMPKSEEVQSVLVVGLGNRNVTADALGPGVVDNLLITRHIIKEYGPAAYDKERMNYVSGIVPGVMAATGMEAAEIVKGVIKQTMPDFIIAVDALAARSIRRLNRTIQLTDTGIHPGSGVGNHRNALTYESLGVPVIAIGVPTVVNAATIVNDAMEHMRKEAGQDMGEAVGTMCATAFGTMGAMTELNNMYVTGKNIDEVVKRLGYTISEALNMALEL